MPVQPRLRLSLATLALVAVLTAFADGFVVVTLQATVGAVERAGDPVRRWLISSLLLTPVHAAAVIGAITVARERLTAARRPLARRASAVMLIIGATTLVGVTQVAGSAAYDYHLQQRRIDASAAHDGRSLWSAFCTLPDLAGPQAAGSATPSPFSSFDPAATASAGAATDEACASCRLKAQTLRVHLRGGVLAVALIVATNTILVVWALAVRGGRLWASRPRTASAG